MFSNSHFSAFPSKFSLPSVSPTRINFTEGINSNYFFAIDNKSGCILTRLNVANISSVNCCGIFLYIQGYSHPV